MLNTNLALSGPFSPCLISSTELSKLTFFVLVLPHAPLPALLLPLSLADFTPENGSTEFWLGSHNCTTGHDQVWPTRESATPLCDVAPDTLEERRMVRPGAQIRVPMGTITLRDMRTWCVVSSSTLEPLVPRARQLTRSSTRRCRHAGMPNLTDQDRIMTAVGYSAAWWPEPEQRMKVSRSFSLRPPRRSLPSLSSSPFPYSPCPTCRRSTCIHESADAVSPSRRPLSRRNPFSPSPTTPSSSSPTTTGSPSRRTGTSPTSRVSSCRTCPGTASARAHPRARRSGSRSTRSGSRRSMCALDLSKCVALDSYVKLHFVPSTSCLEPKETLRPRAW